jgi:WD40 repeat protein
MYVPRTIKSVVTGRGRLSFQECLEISLSLTTALEHLHKHGLIHRDIKPSNIIFVGGVPKLADIGLVTDVGATISYVGTEGFLPPEGPVSPQADIFSLGKVLYEISTGRDRLDFPELPTFLGNDEEKRQLLELNLVFLKACQNDTRKRYQSAREMHADLALLQSGKSLRRARALEQRLVRLTRLGGAAALAVLIAGVAYYWRNQARLKEMKNAVVIRTKAEQMAKTETEEFRQRLVHSYLAHGQQLVEQGDLPGALPWFSQAMIEDQPDPSHQQPHRRRLEELLQACPRLTVLLAHKSPVNSAAFSPDGRQLLTGSDDQTARLWDAWTGEAIGSPFLHPSPVVHVALSSDGQLAAAAMATGQVQLWKVPAGERVASPLGHGSRIAHLLFSPSGRQLLTVADDNSAKVWEVSSARLRWTLTHQDAVMDALWSPNGRFIATASRDRMVQLWDAATGEPMRKPLVHDAPVQELEFSPDSRRLVTASGWHVRVWNVTTGEPAQWILKHDGEVSAISFSPDGQRILTASADQTARLWDALTGKTQGPTLHHSEPVTAATFSPDGRSILTTTRHYAQQWHARTGTTITPPLWHNDPITQAQFGPDGARLLVASADGTVSLWQRRTGASPFPSRLEAKDLRSFTHLLSGHHIDDNEHLAALPVEERYGLWQKLRATYPAEFSSLNVALWHQNEAKASEEERQAWAALFHWTRALAADPQDDKLRQKREAAAAALAAEQDAALRNPAVAQRIAVRPTNAPPRLIDLSAYYNAALSETWFPTNTVPLGSDLSELPQGVQKFGPTEFDVRGLIQLTSSAVENLGAAFPRQINGIPVHRHCRRLHFLHGTAWDTLYGTEIGGYRIHFVNGEQREIKLIFGLNVREWLSTTQSPLTTGAAVAWQGANGASRGLGLTVRVYQMTWMNPLPDVAIASVDFFSSMARPAPFLIALTVE